MSFQYNRPLTEAEIAAIRAIVARDLTVAEQDRIEWAQDAVHEAFIPKKQAARKALEDAADALAAAEDPENAASPDGIHITCCVTRQLIEQHAHISSLKKAVSDAECRVDQTETDELIQADDAPWLAGQVHGAQLLIRFMAKALRESQADLLRVIEAAGDEEACAQLIAELVTSTNI